MSAPAWARGFGVTLVPRAGALDEPLVAALRDGIERSYAGALPAPPPGSACYAVLAGRREVGVLALTRQAGGTRAVLHALAVRADARGHAWGARALRCAERALAAEGVRELYARAPRTNGHAVYFLLRAGYAPLLQPPHQDGCTWFRSAHAPPRAAAGAAAPSAGS